MQNLYALLKSQESILDEKLSVAVRWNVGERIRAINESFVIMNRDLKFLTDIGSDSTVKNQMIYDLPRRQDNMGLFYEDMLTAIFSAGKSHIVLEQKDIIEQTRYIIQKTSYPRIYAVYPNQRQMRLYPIPSTSAFTTTLSADVTSTATSLSVADVSGFATYGYLKIDSEKMEFMATDSSANTITIFKRGIEGTTAAAHTNGTTVTWMDLMYVYLRKPVPLVRYYNTGTALFTNASTTVTGTSTTWTNNLLAGDFIGTGLQTAADPERYYEISSITSNTVLVLKENYAEPTTASVTYGAGQNLDIPVPYQEAILYLSLWKLLSKDDDPKAVPMKEFYNNFISDRRQDGIPADYLPISGRPTLRKSSLGEFRLPVSFTG